MRKGPAGRFRLSSSSVGTAEDFQRRSALEERLTAVRQCAGVFLDGYPRSPHDDRLDMCCVLVRLSNGWLSNVN
jgi:hypothetical protein